MVELHFHLYQVPVYYEMNIGSLEIFDSNVNTT